MQYLLGVAFAEQGLGCVVAGTLNFHTWEASRSRKGG